jgi:hypothetical protein
MTCTYLVSDHRRRPMEFSPAIVGTTTVETIFVLPRDHYAILCTYRCDSCVFCKLLHKLLGSSQQENILDMAMLTMLRLPGSLYRQHSRGGPTLLSFQQRFDVMEDHDPLLPGKSSMDMFEDSLSPEVSPQILPDTSVDTDSLPIPSEGALTPTPSSSPGKLSRSPSFSNSSSYQEDWDTFLPLDRLTFFDLLDNLTISQKLEKWQRTLNIQRERVRRSREKIKSTSMLARNRVVGEWKKRLPTAEEQLEKYRARMRTSVDRLGKRWNDIATVTLREKISFIAGVLNIFISGYLIGAAPQYFYYWYTGQLLYFMPIRVYSYQKRGYHYFLADLCYFVNFLSFLSIWVFPKSKRLLIGTYCLAYGNNAVAIAMWRNSMVFHSLDKVTR